MGDRPRRRSSIERGRRGDRKISIVGSQKCRKGRKLVRSR